MSSSSHFAVSPHVVFEKFDDEIVAIHMETGNYYSLDTSALEIWEWVRNGQSQGAVVALLQDQTDGQHAEIEAAVGKILSEFVGEGLLLPTSDAETKAPAKSGSAGDVKKPFIAPSFSKFSDMQDLLLLDPIHEVDETGWPSAKIS